MITQTSQEPSRAEIIARAIKTYLKDNGIIIDKNDIKNIINIIEVLK